VKLPPLENGDHLDQKTFHERYCAMPEDFRAELVEGMVIVPSPLRRPHGRTHLTFNGWLSTYVAATPGTEAMDNATAILGDESEPQPDSSLYILPEYGGQCRFVDEYLTGAPEWLGEIASSSEAYDLHGKYRDYQRAGVLEYVAVLLREPVVRWFVLHNRRYEPLAPDEAGVFRSVVFPGLWLDSVALLRNDAAAVLATLQQGLQSAEHAAFVQRLQEQARRQT
jgi:Uma2 family endonuclease